METSMHNGSTAAVEKDLNSKNYSESKNIDDISTPSELKFEEDEAAEEDHEILEKKQLIEKCLFDESADLDKWEEFAKTKGGLINDIYRKKIWPLLVGVTESEKTEPPSLDELSQHKEYHQVVLDVNRSLKRFPPGIPYEQRVALQDQLTVLILRVIIKYPHLKYYQGYHDVAITLLLVCGDRASFPLLCRLSYGETAPLAPFMQDTMKPTQHRLNYMLPIIKRENALLAEFLEKSGVGTMFALPWFLTWFGHSLNKYTDVVRLYDFFLCSPPLFPVYVTAAIVIHRQFEVMECECDMAMVHCFLSRLPDDLPFEDILVYAEKLYKNYTPESLELEVLRIEKKEEEQRKAEEDRMKRRQAARRAAAQPSFKTRFGNLTRYLGPRRGFIVATATILLAVFAYYRPDVIPYNINR